MTPTEFKTARESLGFSKHELSRLLRLSGPSAIRYWESGARKVPGPVTVIMEGLLGKGWPTKGS